MKGSAVSTRRWQIGQPVWSAPSQQVRQTRWAQGATGWTLPTVPHSTHGWSGHCRSRVRTRSIHSAWVSSGTEAGNERNSGMWVRSAPSRMSMSRISCAPAVASPVGPSQASAERSGTVRA